MSHVLGAWFELLTWLAMTLIAALIAHTLGERMRSGGTVNTVATAPASLNVTLNGTSYRIALHS